MQRKISYPFSFALFMVVLFSFWGCHKKNAAALPGISAKLAPPAYGVYHSCYPDFSDDEDSVNAASILNFEALANKEVAWVYFSNNWWNGIIFPKKEVQIIHALGKIPYIRMMPRSNDVGNAPDPVFTLQKIIDGEYDAALEKWASDARETNIPLNVEFGIEVNGYWFPWNGSWNGAGTTDGYGNMFEADGPERFKDAYKHIIQLFRKNKVQNVTWFFHVNYDNAPDMSWNSMKNYYPGDDYIDWVAISVYGIQEPTSTEEWQSFEQILDAAYAEFCSITPNKPLSVNEFGVCEAPLLGNKAEWITNALSAIKSGKYPRIKAISYWNEVWINGDNSISDLRINSSPGALNAYKTGVADTFFVSQPTFN